MLIHDPDLNAKGGVTVEQATEFVDLFPTLTELATGETLDVCPLDSAATPLCTEGKSLVPLWTEPARPLRRAAFSAYPRPYQKTPYQPPEAADLQYTPEPSACLTKVCTMGYSILPLGANMRFTMWVNAENGVPDFSRVVGTELYNHTADPQENVNRAYDESHAALVKELTATVKSGWRGSIAM